MPPCLCSCCRCACCSDDPDGVSPGSFTASTPGPCDQSWALARVAASRYTGSPTFIPQHDRGKDCPAPAPPPLHSQSLGRLSTRPAAVVGRCTRPSMHSLCALHGMDLQTNWDSAQHAAATTALADHLSGIVSSTGRLGTWPDRLMAAPRLPWELPTPSLSWSRPGQLLSRARGCVTRSQTGGWRTRCGRSALLPLPFRRRRRRDELFSPARCGAPALLPLQLSPAGSLGRRRRRRDVLCSAARGSSALSPGRP